MKDSFDVSSPVERSQRTVRPIYTDEWKALKDAAAGVSLESGLTMMIAGVGFGVAASGVLTMISSSTIAGRLVAYTLIGLLVGFGALCVWIRNSARSNSDIRALRRFITFIDERFTTVSSDERNDPSISFQLKMRLAGTWSWMDRYEVVIDVGGVVLCSNGLEGFWTWKDEHRRLISIVWGNGKYLDILTVDESFRFLEGQNQKEQKVWAKRLS